MQHGMELHIQGISGIYCPLGFSPAGFWILSKDFTPFSTFLMLSGLPFGSGGSP